MNNRLTNAGAVFSNYAGVKDSNMDYTDVADSTGAFGASLEFNGTTSSVTKTIAPEMDLNTNSVWTMLFTFKINSDTGYICSYYDDATGAIGWGINYSGSALRLIGNNKAVVAYIYPPEQWEFGKWYSVSISYKGLYNAITAEVNGQTATISAQGILTTSSNTNPFVLGHRRSSSWYLDGEISSFSLFKRALFDSEIEKFHNNTLFDYYNNIYENYDISGDKLINITNEIAQNISANIKSDGITPLGLESSQIGDFISQNKFKLSRTEPDLMPKYLCSSDGTNYIDLGIYPTSDIDFIMIGKADLATGTSASFNACGCANASSPSDYAYFNIVSNGKYGVGWGGSSMVYSDVGINTSIHKFEKRGKNLLIDNEPTAISTETTLTSRQSLGLFGRLTPEIDSLGKQSIGIVKIWADSIRSIPLLDAVAVPAGDTTYSTTPAPYNTFFDYVSNSYLEVNGSNLDSVDLTGISDLGPIEKGEAILVSDGTGAYIDTDLSPSGNVSYDLQTAIGSLDIGSWVQGSRTDSERSYIAHVSDTGTVNIGWGDNFTLDAFSTTADNNFHTWRKRDDIHYYDDLEEVYNSNTTNESTITLLGYKYNETVSNFTDAKLNYFMFSYDPSMSTVDADMFVVPQGYKPIGAQFPALSNCMWDSVRKQYFENAGTSSFSVQFL